MEYRSLGRSGLKASLIGLGTEYLVGQTDKQIATVIGNAVYNGINYFDLFAAQPSFRDSMGTAFRDCRDRVLLGAHLGATVSNDQFDKTREPALAREYFEDFLLRYHTDYVDALFVHNVDSQEDYDKAMGTGGLLDLAQRYKREGKARAIGFSGHTVTTARRAVESGQIDVLMFPVNFTGHSVPGRKDLFQLCAASRVGIVAMKPFAGGKLLSATQTMQIEEWQSGGRAQQRERPASITAVQCLAYVASQPGLSTIVPGCKDTRELSDVLAFVRASQEEKDFAPVLSHFAEYVTGECVYCNHCLPCPSGIDIGQTIHLLDESMGEPSDAQRAAYARLTAPASDCIQCGSCEERCPFGVSTVRRIEEAGSVFEAIVPA